MCGIWALFGFDEATCPTCIKSFNRIFHRGPDAWRLDQDSREPLAVLGFQRLTIVDGVHGMQPMRLRRYPRTSLICNGEIYNCQRLKSQHNFPYETSCDVEAIIHMYHNFGIAETVKSLDGVFSFCLVDGEEKKVYLARDPYGVRPLFLLDDKENKSMAVCSEAKGLIELRSKASDTATLAQFAPGQFQVWNLLDSGKVKLHSQQKYYEPGMKPHFVPFVLEEETANMDQYQKTAYLLEAACQKRLMSDRRIGCLLSGGLDSSLIAALVVKLAKKYELPYKVQTFSIGMCDSPDLIAARAVAKHLDTEHHEVRFTENDIRESLDNVIYHLESYDITTIRASLPMYLLSKYIKENTDTTVVFSGEGADEVAQGYIYFKNAPSESLAHKESIRLLSDIYLYDGLRADRTTSAFGLELRVPFLDIEFTHHYLSLPPEARQPVSGVEKHLLRKSFSANDFLPKDIIWRHKEAFSDGVISVKKSLFKVLAEIVAQKMPITMESYYKGPQANTAEAKYYRYVFEKSYPGHHHFTPYYWMPQWVKVTDPSARFIKHYAAE